MTHTHTHSWFCLSSLSIKYIDLSWTNKYTKICTVFPQVHLRICAGRGTHQAIRYQYMPNIFFLPCRRTMPRTWDRSENAGRNAGLNSYVAECWLVSLPLIPKSQLVCFFPEKNNNKVSTFLKNNWQLWAPNNKDTTLLRYWNLISIDKPSWMCQAMSFVQAQSVAILRVHTIQVLVRVPAIRILFK